MGTTEHTLLVVDDDESNRDILGRRLTAKGYRVLVAASGEEALAMVDRESVHMVLLDIMMPGLDGLEVLETLRRSYTSAELPVVMVTAKSDSADVVAALEAGANDFISKPIDFPIALARIQAHLRVRDASRLVSPAPPPAEKKQSEEVGPGTVLAGKYRLDSCIGKGNFGTVYKGHHLDLDLDIALKVLQRRMAGTPDALARFQREAVSTCRVKHPNAVSVTDFGVDRKVAFLVMELLSGHSLHEELARSGCLSVARALEVVLPICSVLSVSHEAGIIHRDIKPANVFLHRAPQGEVVKVLDFGIAKLAGNAVRTVAGMILGTPTYMAPERFESGRYDGRSDVYSLGTMLYQMLSGRVPYTPERDDPMVLAAMKVTEDASPLKEANPELPDALSEVVMRTLSRDPGQRPTASELGQSLALAVGLKKEGWDTAASRLGPQAELPPGLEAPDEAPTEVLPARDVASDEDEPLEV